MPHLKFDPRCVRFVALMCSTMALAGSWNSAWAQSNAASSAGVEAAAQNTASQQTAAVEPVSADGNRPDDSQSSPDVEITEEGTSAAAARKTALAELPIRHLAGKQRQLANEVLKDLSLFRRLPTVRFESDPDVYLFFATHPDVAVSIWRAMDISKFQMWQTGPDSYEADAGDGSLGVVEVLHRGRESNLIYCKGIYKSPLLIKPIEATTLIHLQTRYSRDARGRTFVTHHADLFVTLPSYTVETAARLISPVSNLIADRNFREISLFVQMMSLAMENQPGWVEQLTDRLEGVLPRRKPQLLKLTGHVYAANRKRKMLGLVEDEISLEEVMRSLQEADPVGDSPRAKK